MVAGLEGPVEALDADGALPADAEGLVSRPVIPVYGEP